MIEFHAPHLPEPLPEDQPYLIAILGDSEQPQWVQIVGHYPGLPALCGIASGDDNYCVGRVEVVDCPRCRDQIGETFADWGLKKSSLATQVVDAVNQAKHHQRVRRCGSLDELLAAAASWVPSDHLRTLIEPGEPGTRYDLAFIRSDESPLHNGAYCVLPPMVYLTPHGIGSTRLVVVCEDSRQRVRACLRAR